MGGYRDIIFKLTNFCSFLHWSQKDMATSQLHPLCAWIFLFCQLYAYLNNSVIVALLLNCIIVTYYFAFLLIANWEFCLILQSTCNNSVSPPGVRSCLYIRSILFLNSSYLRISFEINKKKNSKKNTRNILLDFYIYMKYLTVSNKAFIIPKKLFREDKIRDWKMNLPVTLSKCNKCSLYFRVPIHFLLCYWFSYILIFWLKTLHSK